MGMGIDHSCARWTGIGARTTPHAAYRLTHCPLNKNPASFHVLEGASYARGTTLVSSLIDRRISVPAALPYISGRNAPGPCSLLALRRVSPAAALYG